MEEITDSKEIYDFIQKVAAYESPQRAIYMNECETNKKFYFSAQYTQDELDDIEDRGQYPFTINRIRKAIRGIVGMVCSSLPKYKLIPVNTNVQDDYIAEFGNKLLDWLWQNSDGIQGYTKYVKAAARDNIAYQHLIYSDDGKVRAKLHGFKEVIVDPNSSDSLHRDAEMIGIYKYIPIEKAKVLYGENVTFDMNAGWNDSDVEVDLTSGQELEPFLGRLYSSDENYVRIYQYYKKEPYKTENGTYKNRIVKYVLAGLNKLIKEPLPKEITEYPIVPLFVEDTDNPYKLGEVEFLRGMQEFINKAFGVGLYNAQMLSSPKIFVRETDIANANMSEFEDNYARPGSINVLSGNAEDPIVVAGQPLNQAFYTMYSDIKREFEYATLPQEMLGYSEDSPKRKTSHLLDVKESVLESYKDFTSQVEKSMKQIARVGFQYIQAYIQDSAILRFLDASQDLQRIRANKEKGLDVNNQQSVQRYIQYQQNQGVKKEEIRKTLEKAKDDEAYAKSLNYILNDTSALDFDIYIVEGSYAPSYKMGMLRLMMELYEIGAVDNEAVLDQAPIEGKPAIKKRVAENSRLKRKISDMEDEVKALKGMLSKEQKIAANAKIKDAKREEEFKQKKLTLDRKLKNYLEKHKNKMITQKVINQLNDKFRDMVFEMKKGEFEKQMDEKDKAIEEKQGKTIDEIVKELLG